MRKIGTRILSLWAEVEVTRRFSACRDPSYRDAFKLHRAVSLRYMDSVCWSPSGRETEKKRVSLQR